MVGKKAQNKKKRNVKGREKNKGYQSDDRDEVRLKQHSTEL